MPKTDIVRNLQKLEPDLLFFAGDQVYHHHRHNEAWLKFGRDFGEIIRNVPTVCITDDHDVGQGNLWGAAGKRARKMSGADGGYIKPIAYVNNAQRQQMAHLPNPVDPRPLDSGISVHFTALDWGGVRFAILEDRKWKSPPDALRPGAGMRSDHVDDPNYDPASLDDPSLVLLGERQLRFLEAWGNAGGEDAINVVLSQTPFAGLAHLHNRPENRLYADLDSNGWPKSGRERAIRAIREANAFMIAGDQHLATVVQHGIGEWGDAGWQFTVPAIANLYLRWWSPLEEGRNRREGMPEYLGDFHDPLGNKVTMHAVANPELRENSEPLTERAAGLGIIHIDKEARTITMECWPRNADVTGSHKYQYPGWPITIDLDTQQRIAN